MRNRRCRRSSVRLDVRSMLSADGRAFGTGFEQLEQRVLLSADLNPVPDVVREFQTEMTVWGGWQQEVVQNSYLMAFSQHMDEMTAFSTASQFLRSLGVQTDSLRVFGRGGYAQFTTAQRLDEVRVNQRLSMSADVLHLYPERVQYIQQTPNDPQFGDQYYHQNVGQVITGVPGIPGADIGVVEAWAQGFTGSEDVVIAVIDTGVDWNHPDLAANIWTNPFEIPGNGIDDDGNGFVDDVRGWDFGDNNNNPDDDSAQGGHGTAVAGTIGAVGNNGIGVAGVNWTVKILPIKIADSSGRLRNAGIIAAHDYLTDLRARGINIVASNNSYGAFVEANFDEEDRLAFDPVEQMAIQRFVNSGALFIAASGNDGNDNDGMATAFPASYPIPEIISVAATNNRDQLAGFSNFGLTTVDLGAPGVQTLTTRAGGGYEFIDGTSFASPIVAGAVGLMAQAKPDASPQELRAALLAGVDRIPALQGLVVTGGRLNVAESIRILLIEGPQVIAVNPGPITAPVSQITIDFDKELDASTFDPSLVSLIRAGADNVFDTIDDSAIVLTPSSFLVSGERLVIELPITLTPDRYRLTIESGALRDLEGNFLNGTLAVPTSSANEVIVFQVVTNAGVFEPNDTIGTATPVNFQASGTAVIAGARIGDGPNGNRDVDLYRFEITTPGVITLQVDARSLATPSSLDSYLRLFNSGLVEVAANDNFNGLDSRIELFVPTGGVYYVGVSGFGNQTYNPAVLTGRSIGSTGDYNLTIRIDQVANQTRTFSPVAGTLPVAIVSNTTIASNIIVTDQRTIGDVNVRVAIQHDFVGDLNISLRGPTGQIVRLAERRGGSADGYGFVQGGQVNYVTFNDEALVSIGDVVPEMMLDGSRVFVGSVRPESPLNLFDGASAAGVWTLLVEDARTFDDGVLIDWRLDIELINDIFGQFESNDTLATSTALGINGVGAQAIDAFIGDGAFGLRDVDMFFMFAEAGTQITANATPTSGSLDIVMRLFDGQGNQLAVDSRAGSTSAGIVFSVPTGGFFFVGISGAGNAEYNPTVPGSGTPSSATGAYRLNVNVVGGLAEPGGVLSAGPLAVGIDPTGNFGIRDGMTNVGISLNGREFLTGPTQDAQTFYSATYDGFTFVNSNAGATLPVRLQNDSDAVNRRMAVTGLFQGGVLTGTQQGGLDVRRVISFNGDQSVIAVDVMLTNFTGRQIGNVAWAEAFNPQQGLNRGAMSPITRNDVDNATGRLATAVFNDTVFPLGLTIGLASPEYEFGNGTNSAFAAVTSGAFRDPLQLLNSGPLDPDPMGMTGVSADASLAMVYNIGAMGVAESVSFRYFILVGTSEAQVQNLFAQLEDGTGTGILVVDPASPTIAPQPTDPNDPSQVDAYINQVETLPYAVYYPEGFANGRATTTVPIVNANSEAARVVVIARYEVGDRQQVLFDSAVDRADGVLNPNETFLLRVTDPSLFAAGSSTNVASPFDGRMGVRKFAPYALEIRSSVPVGASMSHFDFDIATGEAFTSTLSNVWTFGEGFKGVGVSDFLVFYNPNAEPTKVTLTIYHERTSEIFQISQTVGSERRGGYALGQLDFLPNGPFGMRLDSDAPIVAALSHFDRNIGGGFGVLGTPSIGSLTGVTPEGQLGINAQREFITILNTNTTAANVTLTFFFTDTTAFRTNLTIGAQRRGGLDLSQLPQFPAGRSVYSVSYESSVPVAMTLPSFSFGEATGSAFAAQAATGWVFAEGFLPTGTDTRGSVTHKLRIFNPAQVDLAVEITLVFDDGETETFRRFVTPRAATSFNLNEFVTGVRASVGTDPGVGSRYGVVVRAALPIVAYSSFFDDTLNGGFGTLGTPVGTTNLIFS